MKLEQLTPFVGQLCTLQLHTAWWTMGYRGTTPNGHLCHAATREVKDDAGRGKTELMGPMDLIGPVMLEVQDGALIITHPGPDGSTLKSGCNPEAIAFVNICVAPPQQPSKIILSS